MGMIFLMKFLFIFENSSNTANGSQYQFRIFIRNSLCPGLADGVGSQVWQQTGIIINGLDYGRF